MNHRTVVLVHVCVILAAVVLSFYPVISSGFISLDDGVMLYQNNKVFELSADNVKRYFSEFHWGLYHPLVLLSYALEYRFFNLTPAAYHATNLYLVSILMTPILVALSMSQNPQTILKCTD